MAGPTNIITTPANVQLRSTSGLQQQINDLKNKMSSGGAPDGYSKVSDPAMLIGTSAALTSLDSSERDCNTLLTFQQFAVTQLLAVKEINVSFNKLLQQAATSNPTGFPNFQNDVQIYLERLTNILNTRFAGENPFAGTASNRDAVIDLRTATGLPAGSSIDTTYYTGNTNTTSFNLDDSNTVTLFQVNATHPAIEKLIRALRIATTANSADLKDPALLNARDLTHEVNTTDMGIAIIQASVPVTIIESALENIGPARQNYTEIMQNQVLDDFYRTLMELENAKASLEISNFLMMQETKALNEFLDKL